MIGERIPLRDSIAKVTGTASFLEDIKLPNMLHGKILRSPYGHAKIISIDVEEAKKLPGVVAVLTGKDVGPPGPLVALPFSQMPGPLDEFVLAKEKVCFQGDEVVAVAAETEDIAEDALDLI